MQGSEEQAPLNTNFPKVSFTVILHSVFSSELTFEKFHQGGGKGQVPLQIAQRLVKFLKIQLATKYTMSNHYKADRM